MGGVYVIIDLDVICSYWLFFGCVVFVFLVVLIGGIIYIEFFGWRCWVKIVIGIVDWIDLGDGCVVICFGDIVVWGCIVVYGGKNGYILWKGGLEMSWLLYGYMFWVENV